MKVTGTLINYYFHCKRQCYLHGNRIKLEDNSEDVKIGKVLHEQKKEEAKDTEISIENIKLDKLTSEYLVEIKKSDSDIEAVRWQLLFYLLVLRDKGIERKGKIEFLEKNNSNKKFLYEELTEEKVGKLRVIAQEVEELLQKEAPPEAQFTHRCKKCAYYDYCYI